MNINFAQLKLNQFFGATMITIFSSMKTKKTQNPHLDMIFRDFESQALQFFSTKRFLRKLKFNKNNQSQRKLNLNTDSDFQKK